MTCTSHGDQLVGGNHFKKKSRILSPKKYLWELCSGDPVQKTRCVPVLGMISECALLDALWCLPPTVYVTFRRFFVKNLDRRAVFHILQRELMMDFNVRCGDLGLYTGALFAPAFLRWQLWRIELVLLPVFLAVSWSLMMVLWKGKEVWLEYEREGYLDIGAGGEVVVGETKKEQ